MLLHIWCPQFLDLQTTYSRYCLLDTAIRLTGQIRSNARTSDYIYQMGKRIFEGIVVVTLGDEFAVGLQAK